MESIDDNGNNKDFPWCTVHSDVRSKKTKKWADVMDHLLPQIRDARRNNGNDCPNCPCCCDLQYSSGYATFLKGQTRGPSGRWWSKRRLHDLFGVESSQSRGCGNYPPSPIPRRKERPQVERSSGRSPTWHLSVDLIPTKRQTKLRLLNLDIPYHFVPTKVFLLHEELTCHLLATVYTHGPITPSEK